MLYLFFWPKKELLIIKFPKPIVLWLSLSDRRIKSQLWEVFLIVKTLTLSSIVDLFFLPCLLLAARFPSLRHLCMGDAKPGIVMANRDRELLIPVAHSGEDDDHDSTPKPSPSSSSSSSSSQEVFTNLIPFLSFRFVRAAI